MTVTAMSHACAAGLGAAAALVLFLLLVVGVWAILQRRARDAAIERLDACLGVRVPGDPAARGAFLYASLGKLATVDYEKHDAIRQKAARVMQRV